jgi:WD40 repeat protein
MYTAVRWTILGGLLLASLGCARNPGAAPVIAPAAEDRAGEDGAAPAKPDAFGDPLPPGALARMGTGRLRHAGVVTRVGFAPSGKLITSGNDGTVRVWDGTSGKELLRLDAGKTGVRGLSISRDGKVLAAGSDAVYVWDADTGKLLHRLPGGGLTYGVALSPDGTRLVSADGDNVFRLWDVASGQLARTFSAEETFIPEAAFSPDGKLLATTHTRIVRLWDPATGEMLRSLPDHNGKVYGLAFSPDGTALATGSTDGTVRLWDVATGRLRRALEGHKHQVLAVAYSPDSKKLASAGGDSHVRVWDAATGADLLRILQSHVDSPRPVELRDNVNCVAFSPDGTTLAAGDNSRRVRLWDSATGREKRPPDGHEGHVTRVAFTPDGKRLISACSGGTVVGWDAVTGRADRTYTRDGHHPALSPDGTVLVTAGRWRDIRGWRVATGEPTFHAPEPPGFDGRIAFLPPGRLLAAGWGDARVLDAATGKLVGEAPGGFLAATPGGEVVCREGQSVVIRDPVTREGRALFTLPVPTPPPREDLKGQALSKLVTVWCAAASPDGKTVATASVAMLTNGVMDGPGGVCIPYAENIHLWEVATGRLVREIALPVEGWQVRPRIDHLTFSPDGRTLAGGNTTWGHGTCRASALFWDVATGRKVHEITIPGIMDEFIAACPAFSPDGRTVATGGPDTTALVWPLPPAITAGAGGP